MTKKRKRTPSLRPLSELLRGFRMEIDPHGRGSCVTVSGADRIVSFSDTAVELIGSGRTVAVVGRGLLLTVFDNHTTRITGCVEDIRFT